MKKLERWTMYSPTVIDKGEFVKYDDHVREMRALLAVLYEIANTQEGKGHMRGLAEEAIADGVYEVEKAQRKAAWEWARSEDAVATDQLELVEKAFLAGMHHEETS